MYICDGECENIDSNYSLGYRSVRGTWFVQRATVEKLRIASSCWALPENDRRTHSGAVGTRQVDFIAIDQFPRRMIEDANTTDCIGVGRDHRRVKRELTL